MEHATSPPRARPLLGSSFAGVVCRQVASSWASDARALAPYWPGPFPVDRSLASFNARSSRASSSPSESSDHLSTVRSVDRTHFPGVFAPFNDVTRASPTHERGVPTPLGFRPQAFSTSRRFTSTLELRGLVSCRCRSWAPPSELVPRGDRALLSKPLAPPQSSTGVPERAARVLIASGFCRRPRASAQWPTSPADYGSPFHGPKPASRSPWVSNDGTARFRQLHLPRGFLPPARPYPRPESPRTGEPLLSWTFCSSRDSHVRPSEPLTRPGRARTRAGRQATAAALRTTTPRREPHTRDAR